ncbi:MAG: 7,8-didemethyl-8-hydroxy-5-deazariboflavin synthase CofG, partial [Proteobacteria bacterium]|nr:7,8-didemethyl-8-hydroxy-5-deazariboflavin synthase CofG [Pseudomonadota bacterium]
MNRLNRTAAMSLADNVDLDALVGTAAEIRDSAHHNLVTFSKKVFIPLTHLCRDVCHYCTFAKTPKRVVAPFLTVEQVLDVAGRGAALGCKEALFTLGEKPELRYRAARSALDEMGYASTIDYLHDVARLVHEETGLLPHLNPGTMTAEEVNKLRPVAPSMGLMLESTSEALHAAGGPHEFAPSKRPRVRLRTIEIAGELRVPFTTGILIGIGETRME